MRQEAVVVRESRPRLRPLSTAVAMLFDLDGTLVDTMQTCADGAADVMAEVHGLDWQGARDAYLATSGIPFFQQLELIAPADRRNARAVAAFETRKVEATAHVVPSDATLGALVHETYSSKGLVVLGVNVGDSQSDAEEYARRLKITFPILFDSDEKINDAYLVSGYPTSFFIDSEGIIKSIYIGEMTRDEMEKQVRLVLK